MDDGSILLELRATAPGRRKSEADAWLGVWFHTDPEGWPTIVASTRLTLRDGVTATALQRFPWAHWLRVATGAARLRAERQAGQLDAGGHRRAALVLAENALIPKSAKPKKHPGRPGHPDDFYRRVAEVYRHHDLRGDPAPTKRVQEAFGTKARSTAAGWVAGARSRGYLGASQQGRPGER